MVRANLAMAYVRTFGQAGTSRGLFAAASKERGENGLVIPDVSEAAMSDREIERFKKHGLAVIKIPTIEFAKIRFLLDTHKLSQFKEIRTFWLKQLPKEVQVLFSDGKQPHRRNATEVDSERNLEGLIVVITEKSRTALPSPYEAEATPLYSPQNS